MSAVGLDIVADNGWDDARAPIWAHDPPLVLERNTFMRNLLANLLRDAGASDVMLASHADTAMHAMHERAPSLILSDWTSFTDPNEDRLRLVRRIRETERAPYRDTPVIFVSPPRGRREIEAARDAGVSEFLVTPIAPLTLQTRIRSLETSPRDFIEAQRFAGPDRRRRPRLKQGPSLKRNADVEAGLTTPIAAARAAAVALAHETQLTGDALSIRVGRSLQRFIASIGDYTPTEAEVVDMHRAALAQLARMAENGNPLREPVVQGLEQVVAKRMDRA